MYPNLLDTSQIPCFSEKVRENFDRFTGPIWIRQGEYGSKLRVEVLFLVKTSKPIVAESKIATVTDINEFAARKAKASNVVQFGRRAA